VLALLGACTIYQVPLRPMDTIEPAVTFHDPAPRELAIQFHRGMLSIAPGERLSCKLRVDVCAQSRDELRRRLAQIVPQVEENESKGRTSVAVALPSGATLEEVQTIYCLQVPASVRVRVHSREGTVTVRGFAGRLEVDNGSGNIDVRMAGGSVQLASVTGPISLRGNYGTADVRSEGGRIDVVIPQLPLPGFDLQVDADKGDVFFDLQSGQQHHVRLIGETPRVRPDPEVRVEWNQIQVDRDGNEVQVGRMGDLEGLPSGTVSVAASSGHVYLRLAPSGASPTY